jgi:hypothetical protein
MLNNVVGYWAYIRGLIFGRLIFGGRAYIWNEVSVSTCMWVAYTRGGGGLTVYSEVYGTRGRNRYKHKCYSKLFFSFFHFFVRCCLSCVVLSLSFCFHTLCILCIHLLLY